MIEATLAKVFGTKHDREIKRIRPIVAAINDLEPQLQQLSDADLAAKTADFKQRVANGASLDDILIEAFAVCREAGRRQLNMRHFDVQLIGGVVLHRGRIAEMKTGEGKTLVATSQSNGKAKWFVFSKLLIRVSSAYCVRLPRDVQHNAGNSITLIAGYRLRKCVVQIRRGCNYFTF